MTARPGLTTVVLMLLACTAIVGGDTAGKLLMGQGESQIFVAWSRFALGALVLVPFCGLTRAELPKLLDRRVILRGALIAAGICCILTALRSEPIANVFGAFFIGPIVSYVLSIVLLRETVTLARSALLVLGFAGVLLVVQPGGDTGIGMLWALLAGVFYGGYLTATRWLAVAFRARFLLASQLLIGAVLLAPVGVPHLPGNADLGLWALVAVSAMASAAGNFLILTVNRTTPASVSAPLIYFQLVAATVFGVLVFGTWPDIYSLVGIAVILGSGLGGIVLVRRAVSLNI